MKYLLVQELLFLEMTTKDRNNYFQDFFEELRTYKPDYEDLHNHNLYWNVKNAKKIMSQFKEILKNIVIKIWKS